MRDGGGAARRVVCVHGAGGGGWEWGIWARVLGAHGHAVLAEDLVAAEGGLAATRFADYREQVLRWCAASPMPAVLVGASLGGLLALSAAAHAGVAALVLVNPLPPSGNAARAAPWPELVPWARERSFASTRRALPDADDAARFHAFRRWRDESGTVLNEAHAGVGADVPRCPMLVLASAHDGTVPPAASRTLAYRLGADFELVADASHVGVLLGRRAARAAERVAGWLAARLSAGAV
ncbi:MAG TPA: alpha/beta fold hydrolase [Dokdonella sp.]